MNAKQTLTERIEATEKIILAWCEKADIPVTPDSRIGEEHAALILGFQNTKSLKNLRQQRLGPPHYQKCAGGSRVSYRLNDLARWIEISRRES